MRVSDFCLHGGHAVLLGSFPTLDRDKVRILLLSNDGGWIILMRMVSKQHAGIIQILTTPDLVAANVTGGQKCTDPSVAGHL